MTTMTSGANTSTSNFTTFAKQWKSNELKPQYIQTDDNIADVFTKPLVEVKFVPFRDKLLGENKTG